MTAYWNRLNHGFMRILLESETNISKTFDTFFRALWMLQRYQKLILFSCLLYEKDFLTFWVTSCFLRLSLTRKLYFYSINLSMLSIFLFLWIWNIFKFTKVKHPTVHIWTVTLDASISVDFCLLNLYFQYETGKPHSVESIFRCS